MRFWVFFINIFIYVTCSFSQGLDENKGNDWPEECNIVNITSSADKKIQPAYYYKSSGNKPRPLIVSLHTWSGDFAQKDSFSWQSVTKNYNYIHPNFRGPNWTYEACGSPLVISDIDDAIDYAMMQGNVDKNEIHVIGTSGGGYATLLTYMKSKHRIKSFSAWAAMSNLVDWFYETKSREPKHALDIAEATTGKDFYKNWFYMNKEEAKKRSPVYMQTPVELRKNSKLYIYTGVHDGYTGSVPITHSINIYNKVVQDLGHEDELNQVSKDEIIELLTYRGAAPERKEKIGDKAVHFRKNYKGQVNLTLFEGSHEYLANIALDHVNSKSILTIGDSNGAYEGGWVDQLKGIRFNDFIYNTAVSGNTIGFENNDNIKLNTLLNIDHYLDDAVTELKNLDAIVIALGTNDCKTIFADSLQLVPEKLRELIEKIKSNPAVKNYGSSIYIVSAPPFGKLSETHDEFTNAARRMDWLNLEIAKVAEKQGCKFIDTHTRLKGVMDYLTDDGIHLYPTGQRLMAKIISAAIDFTPTE